jgi:hypothetical protein
MDPGFNELCREAEVFKRSALAESTKSTYRTHLRTFLRFCLYFGRPSLPADQLTLKTYIAFLAWSLNPSSIPGYLNIIRILHVSAGLKNPLDGNWEVDMIKRGVLRKLGRPPVQKLPLTVEILRKLYYLLDLSQPGELSFWAASLVAFFGLLRKNTLLPKTRDATAPSYLVRGDVTEFSAHSFLLDIRHAKTIQFGQRLLKIPYVSCEDERLCAVSFLLRHLVVSPLAANAPLFSYCIGQKVYSWTHASFVKFLKECLTRLGYSSTSYSGHSFRRWGCSACFEADLTVTDIKLRGDCRSNCFEKYLFVPSSSVFKSAVILSNFVAT